MVYGNVDTETIQLNEHTVWSGSPNRNDNPLALDSLAEIRKLIFEGKQKEAEQLANRVIISKKSQGQMFEPVGELQLAFDGHENYTNYYRELDIEKAVAKTSYTSWRCYLYKRSARIFSRPGNCDAINCKQTRKHFFHCFLFNTSAQC